VSSAPVGGGAWSERDLDGEYSWMPVGEMGGHAAIWTDQRGETGEVLVDS
jgi:hypothetical protein